MRRFAVEGIILLVRMALFRVIGLRGQLPHFMDRAVERNYEELS